MKKIVNILTIITLVLTAGCLFAQQVTISGSVVDARGGQPLSFANVSVEGQQVGAATDEDGYFSFTMSLTEEIKLVVSYMGYKKSEKMISPGDQTTDLLFELEPDVIGLEKVVVTALGITKEEKALGYSQQSIGEERLTEVADPNIVTNLSGKAAGVQVVASSGLIGSSARIQIRGISSLTGDNQPLFVVDGIPIDNSAQGNTQNDRYANETYGGFVDFGNAAADISPNDIKSINILKGANAAALYGNRALNGVVEITTKTGKGAGLVQKKGLGISYNTHLTFRTYNPIVKFQDKYGQGGLLDLDDEKASIGEFAYYDGNYGGYNDGTDESWGPPLDGHNSEYYDEWYGDNDRIQVQGAGKPLLIPQFTSPLSDGTIDPGAATWNRTATPWVSHPDNVKDYFETGFSQQHNLSIYGGTRAANYRISYTFQDDKGIVPNTDQLRNSVYLSGSIQVNPKLAVSGVANYVNTDNDNLIGNGYASINPMQQFTGWFGRQVDTQYLKDHVEAADGTPIRWNYAYHDNPYWIANKNTNSRNRHRIFGHLSADYKFYDWLSLTFRGGTDVYSEDIVYRRAKYSNDYPDGRFTSENTLTRETNFDAFLRASYSLTDDIDITGLFGANYRSNYFKWQQTFVDGLIVPDLYSVTNSSVTPTTDVQVREQEYNALYGRISAGFKDYLFVEATGRNDWSSTLPEDNNSYFYPSFTGSFLFSEFLDIDPQDLFGKIRASWAKVGNTADPYSLIGTYTSADPYLGFANLTYGNTMANSTLKPEEKTSIELGTDLKFFNNRLGLSFTYYTENTINQIMPISISGATGFTQKWINAGEIKNSGIEILLNGTPIEKENFRWDIDVNWAKNTNEVVELYGDLESIVLFGGIWGGLDVVARPGEPWGQFYGYETTHHKGKPVLDEDGLLQTDTDETKVLGNVLPDWTGGIRNTFTYGNFSLSALIDMSMGGDIFSVTNMFGWYAGILKETVEGFDYENNGVTYKGDPVTGNDGRVDGILIDGYQLQADGSYVENEEPASIHDWAKGLWPSVGGHSACLFDASWIKLRSVTLRYRIPRKFVSRFGLMGASVSLEGRNLFILYKNAPNIDPETSFSSAIVQGVEQNQLPSTRIFGVNLKLDL